VNPRALRWLFVLLAGFVPARALDLHQRSESSSKQFVVYCEDVRLRQRVASFVEETKADVLRLLGENDRWKAPIVITLERASTLQPGEPPVIVRLMETQPGFKVEINVKFGDDPATVNLQKHIIRAVLLEYAYREAGVTGGMSVVEAPWWIVEGLIEMDRRRESGADSDLFRRLVETNRLPPLESFLVEKPDELGPTALAVDRALAMCLLQLLVEQPGGREKLAHLVRAGPQSDGDPFALLAKEFPVFASGRQTLQKWWTINLARFAAVDRYQGLTTEETEKALAPLLQIEMAINKTGDKKTFGVAEFEQYLKLPASRATLASRRADIVALSTRCHALYRPVLEDYAQIFSLLARGKSHGVRDRLGKVEQYRGFVLRRASDIADYLNWFEATQMGSRSDTFDNYLKTANDISEQDRKQKNPIARYLDELEQEF
jgi:hypothetical protein